MHVKAGVLHGLWEVIMQHVLEMVELRGMSEPRSYFSRKRSALAQTFSIGVCPNKGKRLSFRNLFKTQKSFRAFYIMDHSPW